mmetsp:Transcript_11101/g.24854  ORF Transcript_11101/g.24854 Transcript_11101/m.24854 type:complete len:237 (+) Transcript_11101:422-1132(+)
MELAVDLGGVEFVAQRLFLHWVLSNGPGHCASLYHVFVARKFVFRSRIALWQWHRRIVGAALLLVQISRALGYLFHCHSQKAPPPVALVPSHFGSPVLLAFLRLQGPRRYFVLRHELRRSFHHVLLLLFDGRPGQTQVVQCHVHYRGPNFPNGGGRGGHGGLQLLVLCRETAQLLSQRRQQYCRPHYVRELFGALFAILFGTVLWWCFVQEGQKENDDDDGQWCGATKEICVIKPN